MKKAAQIPSEEDNRGQVGQAEQVGQIGQIGQVNGQDRQDPDTLTRQSMLIQEKPISSDGSDEAVARLASALRKLPGGLEEPAPSGGGDEPVARPASELGNPPGDGEGIQPSIQPSIQSESSAISSLAGREDDYIIDPDILLFEHMERGDLASWIGKAVYSKQIFTDHALWSIFHCRKQA